MKKCFKQKLYEGRRIIISLLLCFFEREEENSFEFFIWKHNFYLLGVQINSVSLIFANSLLAIKSEFYTTTLKKKKIVGWVWSTIDRETQYSHKKIFF